MTITTSIKYLSEFITGFTLEIISFGTILGVMASFFVPIYTFIGFAIFSIIVDFIIGWRASKRRGEPFDPEKVSKTIDKFISYPLVIIISHWLVLVFVPLHLQGTLNFVWLASGVIAVKEVTSIYKKVDFLNGTKLKALIPMLEKFFKRK